MPTYSREQIANVTLSFQPTDWFRVYGGGGYWDLPLIIGVSDPAFASLGTEIYSPFWSIGHNSVMRAYMTDCLQWKGDQQVFDFETQWGVQWKPFKSADRAVRIAILYYTGDSQFGQFYNVPDTHWALATFFDF